MTFSLASPLLYRKVPFAVLRSTFITSCVLILVVIRLLEQHILSDFDIDCTYYILNGLPYCNLKAVSFLGVCLKL